MNVPLIELSDGNKIPQVGLGTWQTKNKAEFHKTGQARSIGVSNYTIRHLGEMNDYAGIKPADDLNDLAKLDRYMRTCWSPVHVP